MLMIFMTSVVISMLLYSVNALLMLKKNYKEKVSPFECGFDPKTHSRLPFSIHFFLIAMIFLIFDVEIALILPMPISKNLINMKYWLLVNIFFIIILTYGVMHEWKQGALQWAQ